MIVLKIGGSSVDSAEAVGRVVELVRGFRERRPAVVVSAMAKTTNRLLESAAAAAAGDLTRAEAIRGELLAFHLREGGLAVPESGRGALHGAIQGFFDGLDRNLTRIGAEAASGRGELSPRDADAVAACGELVSSTILAAALSGAGLEAPWIDCREVVVTDAEHGRARPIYEETDPRLRSALLPHLEAGRVPVLGGYVGATLDGAPTTLGKEGSDFSAAIVGAALGADEVVICTDVEGILTADPRLYPAARRIGTLSFAETLEIASSGGKKPHFGTLGPAARAGVPLRIVSSRAPHGPGTVVGRRATGAAPAVKSIVCRSNALHLSVGRGGRLAGEALLPLLAGPLERLRPALQLLALDEAGATLGLDREERLEEVRAALLEPLGGDGTVAAGPGGTVISLVSEDLANHPDFAARLLAGLADREAALLTRGVAAPVVRIPLSAGRGTPLEGLPETIARLHARLFPGPPESGVP